MGGKLVYLVLKWINILYICSLSSASYLIIPLNHDNTVSNPLGGKINLPLAFATADNSNNKVYENNFIDGLATESLYDDNYIIDTNNDLQDLQDKYVHGGNEFLPRRKLILIDTANYISEGNNVLGVDPLPKMGVNNYHVANGNNGLVFDHLPQSQYKEVEQGEMTLNQQLLTTMLFNAPPAVETLKKYDKHPMSDAARILTHDHNPYMMTGYGYHQPQPVSSNPYGYKDIDQETYEVDHHDNEHEDHGYNEDDYHDDYSKKAKKSMKKKYYKPEAKRKPKKKVKKVLVPIIIKKTKKKKRKTIAVYKGFYVPGGLQIFGKFKKIKDCRKICEITPDCFAADYNPWLKKCYMHGNTTACNNMRTHPKLMHFKKVPCDLIETPRNLVILGARIHGGLEQKGIKDLQDCIKKCSTAGTGIAVNTVPAVIAKQLCFGIDYDFATHKCYFHTDMTLCPGDMAITIPTPSRTVRAPSNILILLCPFSPLTV